MHFIITLFTIIFNIIFYHIHHFNFLLFNYYYFLLELDGGSQVQFNDPPLLLTSLIKTLIYTIFTLIITITIIFTITLIITFHFIFIIITFIFIIFIIFALIFIIIIIFIIAFNSIFTNIYNFSCIQIFVSNNNTFISIIFK